MKDKLQFYSANLIIQSKFTGLRYKFKIIILKTEFNYLF